MDIVQSFDSSSAFDSIKHVIDGIEHWFARELMPLLGYKKWSNFVGIIEKAQSSIINSNYAVENHIASSENVVSRSQGGGSSAEDYKLSKFGCYIISMCGDPRKTEIANAQAYFATKAIERETQEKVGTTSVSKVAVAIAHQILQAAENHKEVTKLIKETRVDVQTSAAFVTQEVKHEVRKGNDAVQLSLFSMQEEVALIKEQLDKVQKQTERKNKQSETYNITVHLTPEEHAVFIALADRAGFSRSAFGYKQFAHLFDDKEAV